jgi:hypothetical protein
MQQAAVVLGARQRTSQKVEVQSEAKALELATTLRRRMVLPTQVVVAAAQTMAREVVEDQESSLFVFQFQPHHLFRRLQ